MPDEMSQEEKNKQIAAEFFQRFLSVLNVAQGDTDEPAICVECGEPITDLEQIGRCVYGNPCGHRQYQGQLRKR